MSQENVELGRATWEESGDLETYVGHEGVRRWAAELDESWETFDVVEPRLEAVGLSE